MTSNTFSTNDFRGAAFSLMALLLGSIGAKAQETQVSFDDAALAAGNYAGEERPKKIADLSKACFY